MAESLAGVTFFDGWTDPRALAAPVNSNGWEDSSFISPSGTTLYFGYTPLNHIAFSEGRVVIDGPTRPDHRGSAFDIYEAHITGGAWQISHSGVNGLDPDLHEAAIGVDRGPRTMAFIRFVDGGDIYLAARQGSTWGVPERLPAPVNSACIEDNPHLSSDGGFLYFDSNRDDAAGTSCRQTFGPEGRDIWVSESRNGSWSVPSRLEGAPNSTDLGWQVFVDETAETAYWSGWDSDCLPGRSCLYRATRDPDGSYQGKMVLARAADPDTAEVGQVIGLGEMSITSDRRFLYFTYILLRSPADVDLSIGVVRRP
ncbi:MAG: hypothetical protein ACR2QM_01780 [Longimicrobiales bacterium]